MAVELVAVQVEGDHIRQEVRLTVLFSQSEQKSAFVSLLPNADSMIGGSPFSGSVIIPAVPSSAIVRVIRRTGAVRHGQQRAIDADEAFFHGSRLFARFCAFLDFRFACSKNHVAGVSLEVQHEFLAIHDIADDIAEHGDVLVGERIFRAHSHRHRPDLNRQRTAIDRKGSPPPHCSQP